MSEGPEVKITAEKLCKAICGKTIDKVYCKTTIGNEFANKIRGSDVRCVETYGKNMVITFSTGIYLRNHMVFATSAMISIVTHTLKTKDNTAGIIITNQIPEAMLQIP